MQKKSNVLSYEFLKNLKFEEIDLSNIEIKFLFNHMSHPHAQRLRSIQPAKNLKFG